MSDIDTLGALKAHGLTWKLPEHFNPDCGISFDESYRSQHGPVGTNLLTYTQAESMVRHMLEGVPDPA